MCGSAVEADVAQPHAPQLRRADGAARMPGIRQIRGRHALDARHERRRSVAGTATMWRVSVAALLAAGLLCPARGPQGSTQLVTVQAPRGATTASLQLWERRGGCWQPRRRPVDGAARPQRPLEREARGRRRDADRHVPVSARRCTASRRIPACRLATTGSSAATGGTRTRAPPTYNTFRHVACGARPAFGGDSEALWRISPQYRYFAVIEYNADPVRARPRLGDLPPRRASARRRAASVFPEPRLVRVLRWLRPAERIR